MNSPSTKSINFHMKFFGVFAAVLWSVIVIYSLIWVWIQHTNELKLLGKIEGSAIFERDNLYHRWAARQGGIYVPVQESTQPNPYLSHIPEQNVLTPSGKQLTLISPDVITQQVFSLAKEYGQTYRGHVAGLKPINPSNLPDKWEKQALMDIVKSAKNVGQIEKIGNYTYYRYMGRLVTEKPCLKCHASQGYREGNIQGGVSLQIPLEPYYAMINDEMRGVYLHHAAIWLLGLGFIVFGTRKLGRITNELHDKAVVLEAEIDERQATQEALQEQAVILEEEIAERRQVEETLRASESKFSRSFDNAPIIMSISKIEDETYLDVNRKFVETTGFSREEAIGRTTTELGWLSQIQRQQLVHELEKCGRISGIELKFKSKEGKSVTCIYHGELIVVNGQQCLLLLGYDVTERHLVEEQLRQAQKMEAIGQLAGGVAHDFNNVLTVIMGYCSLLAMDQKLELHQHERVEHIVEATEKAAQLTRSLLSFSRNEPLNLKTCNLNDVMQQIHRFLIRVIGEDITLKTICIDEPILIDADINKIEQILINLATNARDAMQIGGLLCIETDVLDIDESFVHDHGFGVIGRYGCVTVSDTGCGMDDNTCKRIFEPFFTTKDKDKGTGLGMAIVYGIVKQHNGFINVYSELGQGTTFRIYLPVSKQKLLLLEEDNVLNSNLQGAETILIAEDNSSVRLLLENILTSHGYKVISANDGHEAVEKFTTNRNEIQLVLMDMIMPNKNGQQALTEIKQLQPDIKAFYLSGYTADFLQNRGMDDANFELITKPLRPLELLRRVRDKLDGKIL